MSSSDLRKTLHRLRPAGRRWDRLLLSLELDPDELSDPLASPGPRDFIICGSPRTGTSLLAGTLYRPPNVIVAMEPWDGMRLPPHELFASLRTEIEQTGHLTRQRLDIEALETKGQIEWMREGSSVEVSVEDDYLLGVKWPGFWRYLDRLPDTRFLVCIRHPVSTIASYEKAGGRVREGLNYAIPFNRKMNDYLQQATDEVATRRILLYDYIHDRILPHLERPNVLVVRYERWFDDLEGLLSEIGEFLGIGSLSSNVAIHRPSATRISERQLETIAKLCTTADALGYDIRKPSW